MGARKVNNSAVGSTDSEANDLSFSDVESVDMHAFIDESDTEPALIWKAPLTSESSGAHVEAVQRQLNVPISGIYDRPTKMAVRSFQISKKIKNTGVVDKVTWDNLFEVL